MAQERLAVGPDNPVIRHHLAACTGGAVPERASGAFVEKTFDAFAANLAALSYRAPKLVADLLRELLLPPARQFDIQDLGCGTGLCGPMVRDWARGMRKVSLKHRSRSQECRQSRSARSDCASKLAALFLGGW